MQIIIIIIISLFIVGYTPSIYTLIYTNFTNFTNKPYKSEKILTIKLLKTI